MTSESNIRARLKACNCIADAKAILRETNAGPEAHTAFETAFALRGNEAYRDRLIDAGIKLVETSHEDSMTKHPSANTGEGEKDVKKLTESGDIVSGTGTAGSEQSSSTEQPYPKEGSDGEVTDMESASGEDQMKEGMPQMMPGMMPGMAPQVAQEMGQQMPPLPQMNTPQMMKQMQYTVQEALKPYKTEITRLREAVKALDSRVRETESAKGAMTLDIGSVKENAIVKPYNVRETISHDSIDGIPIPRRSFPGMKLAEIRNEIYEQNRMLDGSQ